MKVLEGIDYLCQPCALAFTKKEELVILDKFYANIEVRHATSAPTTFGGYRLSRPSGVALDKEGNFWIAGTQNHRIEVTSLPSPTRKFFFIADHFFSDLNVLD